MTGHRVQIKNFRVDSHGKIVRSQHYVDVSSRLRQRASKKIRVVSRRTQGR
jgi:hypothetical protein